MTAWSVLKSSVILAFFINFPGRSRDMSLATISVFRITFCFPMRLVCQHFEVLEIIFHPQICMYFQVHGVFLLALLIDFLDRSRDMSLATISVFSIPFHFPMRLACQNFEVLEIIFHPQICMYFLVYGV